MAGDGDNNLLDLVRSAEEEALLKTKTPATALRVQLPRPATPLEEFVDVGDEALELPPSLPPQRAHVSTSEPPAAERASHVSVRPKAAEPATATALKREEIKPGMPPALAIVLALGVAVGLLALLAR